jgi:LysR family nitrogen assimilation transcriptional regulator
LNNIKLQNLRFFIAVYEERSISAAARKVHATQSGVSVQVRDLEDQLGLSLFERVSTGVTPTKAGDQIYRRAIRILREVGRLGEDVSALSDHLTGEVRVGVMPTFARAILAPVLSSFCQANPLVEVRVTEGYSAFLIQMVLAGDLDLAVVPDGVIPGGLRSTFLDTDLELLVSRQSFDGVEGAVDLANMPPLSLVLPGPSNARRAKIDQQLGNLSGVVHSILEMDSMMTTLDIVRRGEWCSILPGCLCLPDLNNPELHLYPIERPKMTVDYLLIEPAAMAASVATRQFTESLTDEIRRACEVCRIHFGQGGSL